MENEWKASEWYGTSDKNVVSEAYVKKVKTPIGRPCKLWLYFSVYFDCWVYTLSAGANSDYSHSGGFPKEIRKDLTKCKDYLDSGNAKLFR